MRYPNHLLKVIDVLRRLPGVGSKSAERFAFHLINWKPEHLHELGDALKEIPFKLSQCGRCGCLKGVEECYFCSASRADPELICVIASPKDAFAMEETGEYRGLYHVLGNLLSPLDGIGPENLNLGALKQRIIQGGIKEVVIALDSTLEGDATSLYIKQEFEEQGLDVSISRLAFGLPMGSSLDYVDGGTLARAFMGRGRF